MTVAQSLAPHAAGSTTSVVEMIREKGMGDKILRVYDEAQEILFTDSSRLVRQDLFKDWRAI